MNLVKHMDDLEYLLKGVQEEPDLLGPAIDDMKDTVSDIHIEAYADGIKCGLILGTLIFTIGTTVFVKNKERIRKIGDWSLQKKDKVR